MSKKIFMDAFFSQFHDFMGELIRVFPNDEDFPACDAGVSLVQRMNPGMVLSEFGKHVLPFEEILRSRDGNFFMFHDFQSLEPDNTMENVIKKLKGYWVDMSEQNKKTVWDYITLLMDIYKRCV